MHCICSLTGGTPDEYGPALIDGTDRDTIIGSDDDVMISADDDGLDKVNAGDDFDVCLFGARDELSNCEY